MEATTERVVVMGLYLEIGVAIVLHMPQGGPEVCNIDEEEVGDMMDRMKHDKDHNSDDDRVAIFLKFSSSAV